MPDDNANMPDFNEQLGHHEYLQENICKTIEFDEQREFDRDEIGNSDNELNVDNAYDQEDSNDEYIANFLNNCVENDDENVELSSDEDSENDSDLDEHPLNSNVIIICFIYSQNFCVVYGTFVIL